jgi:hypothetical protein
MCLYVGTDVVLANILPAVGDRGITHGRFIDFTREVSATLAKKSSDGCVYINDNADELDFMLVRYGKFFGFFRGRYFPTKKLDEKAVASFNSKVEEDIAAVLRESAEKWKKGSSSS